MPESEGKQKKITAKETQTKAGWQFRIPHKYVIYDKIHRTAVFLLVTGTVVGMVRMGIDAFHHIKVRRPILIEKARFDKEAEMEAMQAEREEMMAKQRKLQDDANKL